MCSGAGLGLGPNATEGFAGLWAVLTKRGPFFWGAELRRAHASNRSLGLVQRLEPGMSFGHVRMRLREFAGLSPRFPPVDRAGARNIPDRPVAERWASERLFGPIRRPWGILFESAGSPPPSSRLPRQLAFCGRGRLAAPGSHISMVTALSPMSTCADRPTKVR